VSTSWSTVDSMAREFQEHIKGTLDTPFGEMSFALTSADHVYLSSKTIGEFVVNRVPYYSVSLHLNRLSDGSWARSGFSDPYMTRGQDPHEVSRAAREKAYEGIRASWEAFIAGQDMDIPLMEAELSNLNNEIRRVDEELVTARGTVAELERHREELLEQERRVRAQAGEFTKRGGYPETHDWSPKGRVPEEP